MALALFERYEVKWAAMETGVGGRCASTHVLDVEATVLTNVGSDHAHMLGQTLLAAHARQGGDSAAWCALLYQRTEP